MAKIFVRRYGIGDDSVCIKGHNGAEYPCVVRMCFGGKVEGACGLL